MNKQIIKFSTAALLILLILANTSKVFTTFDGGFIITGSKVTTGDADVLLAKLDANGNTLWEKAYGGLESDEGESVRQLPDGGFLVAGITSSFGAGSYDVYVVRTNSAGDTLWTRTSGGPDDDRGWSVETLDDGCIVVAGWAWSFGAGLGDVYLVKLRYDTPLGINGNSINPTSATLYQNYPNPFNPITKINFELPKGGRVKLIVYDVLGREINKLVNNEPKAAGLYTVEFDGSNFASGVYFYRLDVDNFVQTRRMVLIR